MKRIPQLFTNNFHRPFSWPHRLAKKYCRHRNAAGLRTLLAGLGRHHVPPLQVGSGAEVGKGRTQACGARLRAPLTPWGPATAPRTPLTLWGALSLCAGPDPAQRLPQPRRQGPHQAGCCPLCTGPRHSGPARGSAVSAKCLSRR